MGQASKCKTLARPIEEEEKNKRKAVAWKNCLHNCPEEIKQRAVCVAFPYGPVGEVKCHSSNGKAYAVDATTPKSLCSLITEYLKE